GPLGAAFALLPCRGGNATARGQRNTLASASAVPPPPRPRHPSSAAARRRLPQAGRRAGRAPEARRAPFTLCFGFPPRVDTGNRSRRASLAGERDWRGLLGRRWLLGGRRGSQR